MKRSLYIIFIFLFMSFLSTTVFIFKKYRFDISIEDMLNLYYVGSVYPFKVSILWVAIDYFLKDWINKISGNNKSKDSSQGGLKKDK